MSYSSEVKGELAHLKVNKKCCMLAEIAGFLRVASSIRLAGGGKFSIIASTENSAIARHFKVLIEAYFDNDVSLGVGDSMMPGRSGTRKQYRYYLIISPEDKSSQILRETGMMLVREGNDYFSDGIYPQIVRTKCCKKAYIRGLFLGCGTISDPKKSNHLEFVLESEKVATDLKRLIGSFVDLSANSTRRKDDYIVYMKKSEYITDILKLIGADESVKEYETIRMGKHLHRDAQRIMNCDSANVDRTISAAEEQLRWIRTIEENYGLEWLPPQLREVAKIRMERPDASLTEIGESLSRPIKKPGVSKRFNKLKQLAEEITQDNTAE